MKAKKVFNKEIEVELKNWWEGGICTYIFGMSMKIASLDNLARLGR